MLQVKPTGEACGAYVQGIDFRVPQNEETISQIRKLWLEYHVLIFPNQYLQDDQFEKFAEYFGPIGHDPYIAAMDGKKRIAAIQRGADDTGKIFADVWHSDWSFDEIPPTGTCLLGITIPTVGGDTLFSNQHKAWDEMPPEMKEKYANLVAIHSARDAYSDNGYYAEDEARGSMKILTSMSANSAQRHPLIRRHAESGKIGINGGRYVKALQGFSSVESQELVDELYEWQGRPEFVYRHKWEQGMLVLWDNRSVLHKATGGFEGQARLLHRLTIADDQNYHTRQAA